MKSHILVVAMTVCLAALITGPAARTQSPPPGQPKPRAAAKTLAPFESEAQLAAFLRKVADEQRQLQRRRALEMAGVAPSAAPGAQAAAETVTNVQHAGVDEGGIVKVHGDHLVVLRRGRLFTVRIAGSAMQPVSAIDAFGPGIDPSGAWYDEMLVSDGTVVVVGYSYQRGGTELGLFDIDSTGRLRHRSTYHLRSNDYYSSRNYSSRLIGNTLVFYTPLYLRPDVDDVFAALPALRRWRPGATTKDFRTIAPAARIYRTSETAPSTNLALHTVTTCDLTRTELDCRATAVMGPAGRVFYVSPQSVYIWTTEWSRQRGSGAPSSMLYRMPLDGSAPAALRTAGSPVDQFSFLESDGHLNVLVRSMAAGDGMWRAEVSAGEAALLRIATDSFSDGTVAAPASSYRPLPTPRGWVLQNRFVGDYLLYGTGSGWGGPNAADSASAVHAVQWKGDATIFLPLPHGVDRIEALGANAVAIGTSGRDLHFTPVRLGDRAALGTPYVRRDASQGELRSHGFFYKPDNASTGVLGLPISRAARPGYKHLFESSAAILFLRNQALAFTEVGELAADSERAVDDSCRASCVDWYGNARPLFLRGRVIALLGYELVEAALDGGRLKETQRVSFAPSAR